MLTYAILSPDREMPWGYYCSEIVPTLEELADHMAMIDGLSSRDEWLEANRVSFLGFAIVQ